MRDGETVWEGTGSAKVKELGGEESGQEGAIFPHEIRVQRIAV